MRWSISSNRRLPAGYRQLSRSKIQSRMWAKRASISRAALAAFSRAANASGASSPETRDQSADARTITAVILTEIVGEVALLVSDGDQHVDGDAGGQEEMSRGHFRRCPEGEEKACVERVCNPFVEEGLA